jgi:hypothetical protein
MKILSTIILLIAFLNSLAQFDTESKKFLKEILENETMKKHGTLSIVSSLDSSIVEFHLRKLIESSDNIFPLSRLKLNDSIAITETEKSHLINSLRDQYKIEWKKENFNQYQVIKTDSMLSHLKKGNTTIAIISKPIFIRNGEIGFAFFANFCCGHINGSVNLSFYKKENMTWTPWIHVSMGDF